MSDLSDLRSDIDKSNAALANNIKKLADSIKTWGDTMKKECDDLQVQQEKPKRRSFLKRLIDVFS